MLPELDKLIRLQQTENKIRSLEDSLQEIPGRLTAIEQALAVEQRLLQEANDNLVASQKSRRHQEGELQDLESRRSKYKTQLMEVKTNKEYSAMLHEIENVERDIRSLEDSILVELEAADDLTQRVVDEDRRFREIEERARLDRAALDQEAAALKDDKTALIHERDGIAATLGEELLSLFRRVAQHRNGVAVAEARDESCQVCHMRLRPQMFVDVKRNDAIIQCPSCSRILYFEPAAPAVLLEP
jgi:predicted  nucleic acid-binding Zn-ribbon protein